MTIKAHCRTCGRPHDVPYEENEFFSAGFLRNTFVCDACKTRGVSDPQREPQAVPPSGDPWLPYKD